MAIERITPDHPLWPEFCAHLKRHEMYAPIITHDRMPHPGVYVLCAVVDNHIIGHITLKMQQIMFPNGTEDAALHALSTQYRLPLRELFVQTFAVDVKQRRRGYGRALQNAALDLGKRLGCFQLRSWSPLDCTANCALKLAMDFAAHPAVQTAPTGEQIAGVYFIKPVHTKTRG